MRLLIMGGTRFIGRHLVAALQAGGHDLTLVNRGLTAPAVFADLPQIHVDRRTDALGPALAATGSWDAVLDLSCYYPTDAERLLQALVGRVKRYVFLSTISVYAALNKMDEAGSLPILNEQSPVVPWTAADEAAPEAAGYGARKVACERIVRRWQNQGLDTVILRPSVVYGAHDYTDRMAYWIWRAMSDRPFILPDDGQRVFMRTYAPDLAQALVAAVTGPALVGGVFNMLESQALTWRQTLQQLGAALGTTPGHLAVSVPSETLIGAGLQPSVDIPLWLPADLRFDAPAFWSRAGITETPAAQALAEAASAFRGEGRAPTAGISVEREQEILATLAT
jgi:2'-hydroxyisoflavone reductase